VVTGKARANIRSYLKNLQTQEAVSLGRRLLERELRMLSLSLEDIQPQQIEQVVEEFRLESQDMLLADIALGNHMPLLVARRLAGEEVAPVGDANLPEEPAAGVLAIKGTEGMVVNFANCCRPIPGDAIVGVFNPGKGIVIHQQGCRNLGDYKKHGHKWIEAEWEDDVQGEFATKVRVESNNQRGVLASVASVISQQGSNIEHVGSEERDGLSSTLVFVITVKNRQHLARIMRGVRVLPSVMRITRSRY
jgi:(p)ppGpp synthase/HD superfamily hydrolase